MSSLRFHPVLLILLLVPIQVGLHWNLSRFDLDRVSLPAEEAAERWNPTLFKMFTFGHWPAAIDWLWIRTLQDTSIAHVEEGRHPPFYYDLDLATELDPAFFEIYTGGANLLSVIRDDRWGARDILLKGEKFRKTALSGYPGDFRAKYWARAWELPLLLAYVYLFELNDMPNAAEAFREAALLPRAPDYLTSLKNRLDQPDGVYEVGLRLLDFMIESARESASEERVRNDLLAKKKSLSLNRFLFQINLDFQRFRPVTNRPLTQKFKDFLKKTGMAAQDPMGGALSVDSRGRVVTTTPHVPIFGLE